MYMIFVWVPVKRCDPDSGVNKLMLITATAMFVVATLFEAVSITKDVQVFIEIDLIGGNGDLSISGVHSAQIRSTVVYYAIVSSCLIIFHSTLFMMQMLFGDALLVRFSLAFN
jgi:hypothetical protein